MQSKWKIRQLELSDFYKNYYELLSQLTGLEEDNYDYLEFEKKLFKINNNEYHHIFVIEHEDKIIASITLLIENKFIHNNSCVCHIEDLIIDKDFRGKNISKLLIEYSLEIAKEKKCYKTILNCSNETLKLYEKYGFHVHSYGMRINLEH